MISDSSDIAMTIVMDVIQIVRRINECRVRVTVLVGRQEDPSEGCNLQGVFLRQSDVPVGLSCRSVFRVPPRSSFDILT